MAPTIAAALRFAEEALESSASPRMDAEILLAFCLQKPRSHLFTWPEHGLSDANWQTFQTLLSRRQAGEPIAYITGEREFWSLNLQVSPSTLIPRPETELLVETCLNLLAPQGPLAVLDLGTGSGAIALALAWERPLWQLTAVDISAEALTIAQSNAVRHQLERIRFIQSDWFKNIPPQRFDAIVSNPPYIATQDPHLQQGDLRFEPMHALASGQTGMDAILLLASQARDWLKPGGWLLVEHGYDQRIAVQTALQDFGWQNIQSWQDLQKLDRLTGAQSPNSG